MANQYQHLLTAIDVGSAKTCALVAEITDSGLRYRGRSEEHTSELQSRLHLVCRLLLEKKKKSICTPRILFLDPLHPIDARNLAFHTNWSHCLTIRTDEHLTNYTINRIAHSYLQRLLTG